MPGGRPKGARSRRTKELEQLISDALGPNWCPVVEMARIAQTGMIRSAGTAEAEIYEPVSSEIRMAAYREVAQYVRPKRKAIEHSGANGGAFEVVVTALESEL